MGDKRRKSLSVKLFAGAVIPMIALGIVITIFTLFSFQKQINREVHTELQNMCASVMKTYDMLYAGDYSISGDNMYKGDVLLNGNNNIIDSINEVTSLDMTMFYGDMRIGTTIKDENGDRIIGTLVNEQVVKDVLDGNMSRFYENISVNGENYYAFYSPILDGNGKNIGMIFVGKPSREVNGFIHISLIPITVAAFIGTLVAGAISILFTKNIIKIIKKIQTSLDHISRGMLDYSIPGEIIYRRDEFGDIGKSIVIMQHSLKELIELDALTKLYNRRSGEIKLQQTIENSCSMNMEFSVAIGDIDFFKNINDTYGHDGGDFVLQNVAAILESSMTGRGYVARWGGEEFLLVYEDCGYHEAVAELNRTLKEIRDSEFEYRDNNIRLTMTFGITEGNFSEETHVMMREADTLMYCGKTNGRNQVVAHKCIQNCS